MNKQNLSAVPDENKIEELLGKIQPVPSENFHQKMRQASWLGKQSHPDMSSYRFRMALAAMVIVILATLAATPQGRAWAQEVVQFFKRVNFTSIPVSPEEQEWMSARGETYDLPLVPVFIPTPAPEMMSLEECQAPQNIHSYACQVAYAESKLGFDLKEFPKTPEGWIFKSIIFDTALQTATITYTHYSEHGGDFVLKQGFGEFQNAYGIWSLVPAEKVETVKIGSYTGEYVLGGFSLIQGDNEWRWYSEDSIQRLGWSDGSRWYYIEILPPSPGHITRDQLVELAASIVNSPTEVADPLNPDSLTSIADAEQYSKLDLKAPTLLPLGYEFSYARYFSFNNEVHLHYNYGQDLVIYEWQGNPYNFDALSKIYSDHEIVTVNGEPAFYGVPKAVSQYESTYLFLAWRDDNLNYQIYFYFDPSWGGGLLDKSRMITIAESMGDINDYKRNDLKPYEYVGVYEQSLGFQIKKFPMEPTGWSFADVSAYTHPDCISMSYAAMKESGWLYLRQCNSNTDKYFDLRNVPSDAIERIKIGKNNGQYIIGNFDTGDDGKTFWNSDLLYRRLRWQEDGLWLELVIHGDSALLHDKEDMTAYAESLQ